MAAAWFPVPPSDYEKRLYTNPNALVFFLAGATTLSVFIYCSYWFVSKSIWLLPYALFCTAYFANVGFCTFGSLFARRFDQAAHNQVRFPHVDYLPTVDVYLPSCGESIELLSNTYRAVHKLDYPNYQVWVLDDSARAEVQILAELHGFHYIARPNPGELKKAGNLRYAFSQTEGEFYLVLDADFVPRADFLREAIPYFAEDPQIAILQTPQYFQVNPKQPAIERGATYLQEVFHRLVQNFRNAWGASVCTGSCAIYRRAALAPVGGAYPVERSEDVNTGMYVLRSGWKIHYLPLILSAGLSPDTIEAFFNQHYRWCSGSIVLITSKLFWCQPKVGILGKFSYLLSILYYCTSGLGVFCFSLPTLINVWLVPQDFALANYSLIFPAVALVLVARGFWAKNPWSLAPLVATYAGAYTHLTALIDVISGDIAPWIPTGAAVGTKKQTRFDKFKFLLVIVSPTMICLLLLGLIVQHVTIYHSWLVLAWMSLQLFLQHLVLQHMWKDAQFRQG